eukprot:scaffold24791_cov153-Skeletonema_marinoi.AAC.8
MNEYLATSTNYRGCVASQAGLNTWTSSARKQKEAPERGLRTEKVLRTVQPQRRHSIKETLEDSGWSSSEESPTIS